MNNKENKHRFRHFCMRILNEKSPHLNRLYKDIYQSRNFLHTGTITQEAAIREAAKAQVLFLETLTKGEKVHIVNKKHPNIIVGKVLSIGKTTFRIKDDNRFYQLSEIITIG